MAFTNGIVDKQLEEEIYLKQKKIEGNPDYFVARKRVIVEGLRTLGNIHSFWIENPELRREMLLERKQPKTLKKLARVGIHYVQNGWDYLHKKRENNSDNFINAFNEVILKKTNYLVEPKTGEIEIIGKKKTKKFRQKDVTLNIPYYTPMSWEKIPEKIGELINSIKKRNSENPLESAIMAHIGLVGIQPFMEGNKRTARLIQNRILHSAGFPPSVIPAGEGKFYFNLLRKVLPCYQEGDIQGQKQFYNYCASKVNNNLDEILGDLQP